MNPNANIFLIGPMGVGKSTIGRHLARLLGKRFIDLDTEIETRCGASIAWIFDVEGEAGFRDRETAMLRERATGDNLVLATGGGVVLRPANRALLRERGLVVYLAASAQQLHERTRHDTHRPLLQTGDRKATLTRILSERDPLYQETAHLIYRSRQHSALAAAEELRERIHLHQRQP